MMLPVVASKKSRGFLLLEVLLVAGLLLATAGWLGTAYEAYCRSTYREQARFVARSFAGELRQLQRMAMFRNDRKVWTLSMNSANSGQYILSSGITAADKRYVRFAELGCGNVYFSKPLSSSVRFSSTGSPSTSGTFEFKHRQLQKFSCKVILQPVTGRVVIEE